MDIQRLQAGLADLRPEDKLTATIAHWNETPKEKNSKDLCAASYATAIMVNRRVRWIMWGVGYSPEAISPQVFGIRSLIQLVPEGRWLEVHAHVELARYIKFGGIGRYAMDHGGRTKTSGKLLGCYPAIADIITASDAHRWALCPHRSIADAPNHGTAKGISIGKAKAAALQHKADHAPTSETYPKPIILEEFVDVLSG